MRTTLRILAVSLISAPAFGQADECSAATNLGTGPTTAPFDTFACTDTGLPATTSSEQQCASLSEDVWFKYTAQTTGLASFDTCNNATFDTEIGVWEGSDCSTFVGLGCNDDNAGGGCTANTSLLANVPVTAGQTYYIQVGYWNSAGGVWGTGTLTILEYADPCSVVPDDGLEDNDDCGTAFALTSPSMNTGLFASLTDSDFYSITIPAGETLFVDCLYTVTNGDLDVYVWDPTVACDSNITGEGTAGTVGALAVGFTSTDDENLAIPNFTGAPLPVIIEIDVWSGSATGCNTYDLNVVTQLDPCTIADAFEDNDDCPGAAAIGSGTINALNVQANDSDFFAFTIPAGGTVTVDCLHLVAEADIDIYLWDPTIACDTAITGEGTAGTVNALAVGFTGSDNEFVTYTNPGGSNLDVVLEVRVWSGSTGACAGYDLVVAGAGGGPGPVGNNYCSANPNSTGATGSISGIGRTQVAANDLTLTASSLPVGQFGIFIVSRTQGFVPNAGGTSNGNLCVGGQIGRFVGPGQIVQANGSGEFSLPVDLTAIPQGAGTVAVVPGDTFNFQAWHRDSVGLGSNFTDGLSVNFN